MSECPTLNLVTPNKIAVSTPKNSKRHEDLLKSILPETNGKGVPSPFKKHLFWPESPKETTNKKRVKLPSVVSSKEWQAYEEKKRAESQIKEREREERKMKREDAKQLKVCKGKCKSRKTREVNDVDEEWTCDQCGLCYSSELIRGIRKRWAECDTCKKHYHYKCIPKKHLKL